MNKVAVYCDQNFLSNQKLCLKSVSEAKMCALFLPYNCSSQNPIFYFALLTSMFALFLFAFVGALLFVGTPLPAAVQQWSSVNQKKCNSTLTGLDKLFTGEKKIGTLDPENMIVVKSW